MKHGDRHFEASWAPGPADQIKFCSPSADMRQSNSLPVHPAVGEFAALAKRSLGGIDLLEHDVATFVTTATIRMTAHAEKRIDKS